MGCAFFTWQPKWNSRLFVSFKIDYIGDAPISVAPQHRDTTASVSMTTSLCCRLMGSISISPTKRCLINYRCSELSIPRASCLASHRRWLFWAASQAREELTLYFAQQKPACTLKNDGTFIFLNVLTTFSLSIPYKVLRGLEAMLIKTPYLTQSPTF